MAAQWYYLDAENKPVGPFSPEELTVALDGVEGAERVYVCEDGGAKWRPFGKVLDSNSALLGFVLRVLFLAKRGGFALDAAPVAAETLARVPVAAPDDFAEAMRVRFAEATAAAGRPECGRLTDLAGAPFWKTLHTNLRVFDGNRRRDAQWRDAEFHHAHPCRELVRVRDSRKKRDWRRRWTAAGGALFEKGRMAAPADSPVWVRISRWKQPWAPLDIGSGMEVVPLARAEAEVLGVIAPGTVVPEPPEPPAAPAASGVNTAFWSGEARRSLAAFFAGAISVEGTVATVAFA